MTCSSFKSTLTPAAVLYLKAAVMQHKYNVPKVLIMKFIRGQKLA